MRQISLNNRIYFFDLDGTLLNPKKRLFTLFHELSPNKKVTFDTYWELKRANVSQREMLQRFYDFDDIQAKQFMAQWIEHIEDEQLLALDTLYPDALELLDKCAQNGKVYIVTGRQSFAKAEDQIKQLGLTSFVTNLFVTEHKKSKYELIMTGLQPQINDVFIGDTAEDIQTGKKLGVKTIGMTHGFLNFNEIEKLAPDMIARNTTDLSNLLNI